MDTQATTTTTDSQTFYAITQDSNVKKVYGEVYIAPNLSLIDISLKGRGRKEDHLFAISQFLRENVRRGVSFLEEDTKGITICRRGLQKFFDLKDEYLEILDGLTDFRGARLDKDEEKLFHVIFDEVEQSLIQGKTVTVYKTEKANGENAQVSYNKKYDAWIIASKNVSLMMRNAEDIRVYQNSSTKSRYAFAILIAEAWLDILAKHIKDVEGLKKELEGKTLVGEYCGNPKHQHLVEYNEITIYFFALVDMRGHRSCYPMSVTKEFFTKYNLPMVRIIPRKECTTRRELVDILQELAREVAQNTIEEDAEGSVVYFEVTNENGSEILSLCKVKTLEYRVYRKLREKLKSMISKGKTVEAQMRAYKKEVGVLCYRYNLPNPTDYYYSIAQLAFEFVDSRRDIASRLGLSNRYLDFLKVIKACKMKGVKPKAEHFQKLIDEANDLSDDSDIGDEKVEEEEKPKKNEGKQRPKKSRDESEEEEKPKGKQKPKKSRDESEEEEKKVDMIPDQSGQNRVIIITPPLYFDHRTIQKLQELQGHRDLEEEWNEDTPLTGKSVVLLHKLPEVTKADLLEKNTFFIVTGFKEAKNLTLKKLDNLAKYGIGDMKFNKAELDYINSEDKAQKLEQIWTDQKNFIESLKKVLPNNFTELQISKPEKIVEDVINVFNKLASKNPQTQPEIEYKAPKPKSKGKKQVLVFIPTGLPGMGKSTHFKNIAEMFENKGYPVTTISSDKVRKELMDKLWEENPDLTHQEAFERSNKEAKPKFFEYVGKAVEKTSTITKDLHVVILDKNHPPSIIQDAIDFFRNPKYKKEYIVKIAIIKPICVEGFRTKEGAFPYSLNFFLKCMQRALGRDEHETLIGGETKVATVLFGFLNSHRNFRATSSGFLSMGADIVVELPFTHENEKIETELRQLMGETVGKVMRSLKNFEAGKEEMKEFLEKMKSLEIELENPDEKELQEKTVKAVEKCLDLFTTTT